MKKLLTILLAITLITLTSCGKANSIPTPSDDNSTTEEDETADMKLTLKIDGTEVDEYGLIMILQKH